VTWRGVAITQIWMVSTSLLFVMLPRELFALFHEPGVAPTLRDVVIADMGVVLLRYVALYGLLDGFNMVLMSALQGAGDTRFSFQAMLLANLFFATALVMLDRRGSGVYALWTAATVYVMGVAGVWLLRFRGGRWRAMRVVETPAPGVS
jgi:MATE family multidrug resistance protein